MKTKRVKAIAVVAVAAVFFASPARAFLGLGDVVFDPTNYAQAIKTFIQLEQEYAQLIQIYQQSRQQYEQMLWMAKSIPANLRDRYRAVVTPWTNTSATNTYGMTGGWVSAINSGVGVNSGYSQATQPLDTYGAALGNIPSDQLDRVKTSYATVELADGANLEGLQTIGSIRANTPALEQTLEALEQDSLSSDPDQNTEIAELNKINAAGLIALRGTQDTNKLLVTIAESQIVAAKRSRDAEAQGIHEHARFMGEEQAMLTSQASDASQAMLNWRMP